MKYFYEVKIVQPEQLVVVLNVQGKCSYSLKFITPLQTFKGVSINGTPNIDLTYLLIFEKFEET